MKILDFGCGAGRVTRWLCAAFPEAEISVTDLRETDLEFCAKNFRVTPWLSGTEIDALQAPDRYDLIWVGSVLTHLSAAKSLNLLNKLIGWTRQGPARRQPAWADCDRHPPPECMRLSARFRLANH
jgi:trans-aconitate methyltransferase